ncbi:hypothetical protein AAFF_G00074670 [Aldrovandia affinis]|uniref:Uncharacterized protein n=1 Tax=Aldrovandia affinis TaxID=143900 RepID=A0AAD7RYC9_9TELE|nr:hypothetical protein AAFF_G00074670 [Aldrovandia affinis]
MIWAFSNPKVGSEDEDDETKEPMFEHLRPSSESIKATARKLQVDHLRSEDCNSRILIQAHWERPDPGSRGSQESLSPPFDASSHQLSQRVYPQEGLHHCQLNELLTFNKVQNTPAGYTTPLPAIPGSHLVKTHITQNAPPHSLRSERPPASRPSMPPAGSKCEDSVEMGRPALAALVRLRALLAQGYRSLSSLCVVHQGAVCCRHYYASAIVFWLLCIITTTIVLIAATAFRSNHKRD